MGYVAPRRASARAAERWAIMLSAWGLLILTLGMSAVVVAHLSLFAPGFAPLDRVFSALLLLSEIFVTAQGSAYYLSVWQATRTPNIARETRLARLNVPTVAIFIATYNEAAAVIEATVMAVSLLRYPAKRVYLNCDHPSPEQAARVAAIARRHQVEFIHRVPNTGFKAGGINALLGRLGRDLPDAELLCVFDADSLPVPTFLGEIVPAFHDDPRLAFAQAPQSYGNRDVSPVADAAGQQQETFAHYIAEGKQRHEAMFFCGTNVVFRVDALRDIGGLVTSSITEDFATSIALHRRGWRSRYCNTAYVTGIGPTTLDAYWTQQGRWALGNLESFLNAIPLIFWRRGFTLAQRWEYGVSGTYYLTGLNTMIALLCPVAYLLLNAKPLLLNPWLYLLVFMPHFALANAFFLITMGRRGATTRANLLAQSLTFITTPIYCSAALAALARRKRPFAVTPKGGGGRVGWRDLRWHLALGGVLVAGIVGGTIRLVAQEQPLLLINLFWCGYYLALFSGLFHFNRPVAEEQSERDTSAAA